MPAAVDYFDPPAADPAPVLDYVPRPDPGLGVVVTIANILISLIVIIGMWLDSQQTGKAIIAGALYFGVTTPVYVGLITGSLPAIVAAWQRERTERHRIDAYADLAELSLRHRLAVERNERLRLAPPAATPALPADPLQTPAPPDTFVAPYASDADQVAQEALAWLATLYGPDHRPDPDKVIMSGPAAGRLRVRMLGSKRGTGSREAGLWLLHKRAILKVEGGHALNLSRLPYSWNLRELT